MPQIYKNREKGLRKVDMHFTGMKDRAERKHLVANPSASYEDLEIGKRTFVSHNRKTMNEYNQEKVMGTKKRINTFYEMRNGLPVSSLGDKIYKAPDYQPGFFRDGGLVAGSTYNYNYYCYQSSEENEDCREC